MKFGPSLLLSVVTQNVIKFKRGTGEWMDFLLNESKQDMDGLVYLTEILISQDRLKEALQILAHAIKAVPR